MHFYREVTVIKLREGSVTSSDVKVAEYAAEHKAPKKSKLKRKDKSSHTAQPGITVVNKSFEVCQR